MKKRKHRKAARMGRPISVDAAQSINYRVDKDTIRAIEILTKQWNCTKSEVVRKALKDAAGLSTE